jgi:hypothetical protein
VRRRGFGLIVAVATVSLTACGSSQTGAHLTDREQISNACGDLKARIEGIGNKAGIRDPQPATLRGSSTVKRLRPATKEALSRLSESAKELGRLHAPRRAVEAVSEGVEGYDAFARQMVGDRSRSESSNFKLETDFTSIGLRAAVRCLHAARRGASSQAG